MNNVIWIIIFIFLGGHLGLAQRALSDEQWLKDFAFVQQQITALHPGWYGGEAPGAFESAITALSGKLKGKSDLEIALELQAIIAKGADSQTKLDLTPALQRERVIPAGFGWYSDGLYVSGGVRAFEKAMGKRIISINGFPPEEALGKVGRFSAEENNYTLTRDGLAWLRFPGVFRYAGLSKDDTLHLQLDNPGGVPLKADLYPIDVRSPGSNMMPVALQSEKRDLRWQPTQSLYEIYWLPDHKTVYFQINRSLSREMALTRGDTLMANQLPPFQFYADTLLNLLKQEPEAKLLIDLRFNTDGYADDAIALLKELKRLPVGKAKKKLFVATNTYTQNGALETALHYQFNSNATLVGEPSGQRPSFYFAAKTLTLPNSRLPLLVATQRYKNDKVKGPVLQPDVLLPLHFEDFRQGKDPVLDYVKQF
ncbi:MAG: hypothetical protein ACOYNO_05485 [Saprospiraceae bacterium]